MPIAVLENAAIRKQVIPISVAQYHQMNELGIISKKTELICGIILEKMSKSPLHTYMIHLLHKFFVRHLPEAYLVRKEDPLTLAYSEPEPDLSIVKGDFVDFKTVHPSYAELVIEVAVSSLESDRAKSNIYALAKIPEYWVVIPTKKQVEVYTVPENGEYRVVQVYRKTEKIKVMDHLMLTLGDFFD